MHELRLVRQAKLIGLPFDELRRLVRQASEAECRTFVDEFLAGVGRQRAALARRIEELRQLDLLLGQLEERIAHADCDCAPGQTSADCNYCSVLEKGGELDVELVSV